MRATSTTSGRRRRWCGVKNLVLASVCMALLLIVSCGERILFKVLLDRMESYRYFIVQTITFLYIPPLFIAIGCKATQSDYLDAEFIEFPKSYFFLMGFLDLLHTMMLFLPGGKTPAPLTVLLVQAIIPITIFFSFTILNIRYSKMQIGSGLLIALGCITLIVPLFFGYEGSSFAEKEAAWNSIIYALAAVPGSLSLLFKEKTIHHLPMDLFYLNAWVSVYQFFLGILIAPFIFDIQAFNLNQKLGGLNCFFNGKGENASDNCEWGIVLILGYVLLNTLMHGFIMGVIRYTKVSVMYAIMCVSLPISFLIMEFYQDTKMDEESVSSSVEYDLIGFFAIFIGMVIYRMESEPNQEALTMSAEEKEALSIKVEEQEDKQQYGSFY